MQSGSNGPSLESMRKQGLDANGQPVSSYWKARIEAEEGRVRVQELEAEVERLRTHQSNLRPTTDTQVTELKSALSESEYARRTAASNFQKRLQDLHLQAQNLRKEVQEITRSRDFWKSETEMLRKTVKDLYESSQPLEVSEIVPLGRTPTLRDFLLWMGIRLPEGRVLAVGDDSGTRISIEVQNGNLCRVIEMDAGRRKSIKSISLQSSISALVSIFLPYQSYSVFQTDPRILEVFHVLGRPLNTL